MIIPDISIGEYDNELTDLNRYIIELISEQKLVEDQPKFDVFTGILHTLGELSPKVKEFFNGINCLIQMFFQSLVIDYFPSSCPECGSDDITDHQKYGKRIRTLVGIVELDVQRYRCRTCGGTFSKEKETDDPFTFYRGQISKSVSKLMVQLYIGGCSLRYTEDVVKATTGIGVEHPTIRRHVIKWGYKVKEDRQDEITGETFEELQMDEQYFEIRTCDPENKSVQIIMMLDPNQDKIVGMDDNYASQVSTLNVKKSLEQLDEPPVRLISDGAKAYKSHTDEENIDWGECIQHQGRNKRKKTKVKSMITEQAEETMDQMKRYDKQEWKKYREFMHDWLERLKDEKKITEEIVEMEKEEIERMEQEDLEETYEGESGETLQLILEAIFHRRFYCGFEAAERMKYVNNRGYTIEEALDITMDTAKVEGIHCNHRARIDHGKFYGSKPMIVSITTLFGELHNQRRGHGLAEAPFTEFPARKTESKVSQDREITVRDSKYGKQVSHQIDVMSEKLCKVQIGA